MIQRGAAGAEDETGNKKPERMLAFLPASENVDGSGLYLKAAMAASLYQNKTNQCFLG